MKATIELSMQASNEALEVARMLWNTRASNRAAISRAYYAVFYASQAMLETKKLVASSHSAQIALFNQHFIHPGIIAKQFGKLLGHLFAKRQDSDYELQVPISDQDVENALREAQLFVDEVKNYLISNQFWSQS